MVLLVDYLFFWDGTWKTGTRRQALWLERSGKGFWKDSRDLDLFFYARKHFQFPDLDTPSDSYTVDELGELFVTITGGYKTEEGKDITYRFLYKHEFSYFRLVATSGAFYVAKPDNTWEYDYGTTSEESTEEESKDEAKDEAENQAMDQFEDLLRTDNWLWLNETRYASKDAGNEFIEKTDEVEVEKDVEWNQWILGATVDTDYAQYGYLETDKLVYHRYSFSRKKAYKERKRKDADTDRSGFQRSLDDFSSD